MQIAIIYIGLSIGAIDFARKKKGHIGLGNRTFFTPMGQLPANGRVSHSAYLRQREVGVYFCVRANGTAKICLPTIGVTGICPLPKCGAGQSKSGILSIRKDNRGAFCGRSIFLGSAGGLPGGGLGAVFGPFRTMGARWRRFFRYQRKIRNFFQEKMSVLPKYDFKRWQTAASISYFSPILEALDFGKGGGLRVAGAGWWLPGAFLRASAPMLASLSRPFGPVGVGNGHRW